MSRPPFHRPPVPPPEKLRAEQRSQLRKKQRDERARPAPQRAVEEGWARAHRRKRKRFLALRRQEASLLPSPLACYVEARGAGDLDGAAALGWKAVWRDGRWGRVGMSILALLPVAYWLATWQARSVSPLGLLLWTLIALIPAATFLQDAARKARIRVPASLSVHPKAVRIEWEKGPTLEIPIEEIQSVEPTTDAPWIPVEGPSNCADDRPGEVVLARQGGATFRVQTTARIAYRLVAAVEVARGDMAGFLASQPKARPGDEAPAPGEPEAPPVPALPSETALAALDREGRSLEDWKRALRTTFADGGYRSTPPLLPDDLLPLITDPRLPPERRLGAALALSLRADASLRAHLRIASESLETKSLRLAVEQAAEGTLEEEAMEEAVGGGWEREDEDTKG